jgi:hypothetical protein
VKKGVRQDGGGIKKSNRAGEFDQNILYACNRNITNSFVQSEIKISQSHNN